MSAGNLEHRVEGTDWRWTAALAVILLAGGVAALVVAAGSVAGSLAVFGAAFLCGGAMQVAMSFIGESERGARWAGRALGAMMALLGAALLFDPFAGLGPLARAAIAGARETARRGSR